MCGQVMDRLLVSCSLLLLPAVVRAQEAQAVARGFLAKINEVILFPLIALMMAVALLVFLYGAYEFIAGADSDSDRAKGRQHLLWGIVGMVVMVSAFAILSIAANTFGLGSELQNTQQRPPQTQDDPFMLQGLVL